MNLQEIKNNYPLATNWTYLDTARLGALSTNTISTWKSHIDDQSGNGVANREVWVAVGEAAREKAARLLNVSVSEIGFPTDVSTGMSIIATGLRDLKKVLLIRDDFPSVGIPWARGGFEIHWLEREPDLRIDINKIEEKIKKGIDLMALSWVQYNSGFRIDLGSLSEICHRHGTRLIVDGTQGLGAYPINPKELGLDAFMASSFKWLTAGYGVAVKYLDEDFRRMLDMKVGGWNSLVDFHGSLEDDGNYKPRTEAVEMGHPKFPSLYCLNSALETLEKVGFSNIHERTNYLSGYLQKKIQENGLIGLSNFSEEESSGIRLLGGNRKTFDRLVEQNIRVTFRADYFRVAPYFYNDEKDIDRLIECCR